MPATIRKGSRCSTPSILRWRSPHRAACLSRCSPTLRAFRSSAIARRLADLAGRANQGTLTSGDLSGGTFTLSNLGMYGVTQFIPIINPPQAAILGVGAARPGLLPQGESGTRRVSLLSLSLSADHRVLDGAEAAAFLTGLKDELERCPLDQIQIETPEE